MGRYGHYRRDFLEGDHYTVVVGGKTVLSGTWGQDKTLVALAGQLCSFSSGCGTFHLSGVASCPCWYGHSGTFFAVTFSTKAVRGVNGLCIASSHVQG